MNRLRLRLTQAILFVLFAAEATPPRAEEASASPAALSGDENEAVPSATLRGQAALSGDADAAGFEGRPVRLPPLLWYEADPALQRRLLMVSMLYWDFREQETAHKLLLPVFYRWRDEDRTLLVSLPFVVGYRRPLDKWLVAGLFYRRSTAEKTHTALFPLYWQKIKRDGGRTTVAAPFLFYDYRSHDRSRVDQVSLLGWTRRRPERRMGILGNVWWSTEDEAAFRTVFPLYWDFWSPGDRLRAAFPFYLRRRVPAAARRVDGTFDAGAVRTSAGLFPLLGAGWGRDYSAHYLFPLYYRSRAPERRVFATLPASHGRDGDRTWGHLGLYYFSRDADLKVHGLFPLWFDRRTTDGFERKTQVLNYYHRVENEDSFRTLFPLYGYWSSPGEKRLLSWGVWWRGDDGESTGWAYLYHWKRSALGDTTRVFFPLYWHFYREPGWGVDVVFPVYTRYRDGDTTVTAIPPVIWKTSPDRRTWSLFFLYWRDAQEDRGSTTLFPFFHDSYDARRRMFFSPLVWTRRSALSREGLAPPLYWYRSEEARRTFVMPLYWSTVTPDRRFLLVPPYYRWRGEDARAYGLFPLWGRQFSKTERGSYLLPFYWYNGNGRGDGLWIVPPLLMYVGRHGTGTDDPTLQMQYLFLGSVQKSTDTLAHDFFPLYRYVSEPGFKNFWAPRGLALAAWERRRDVRKGYVFPYLWRRGPEKDWELFLPLWYGSREYAVTGDTETVRVRGEKTGGASVFFPLYWAGRNPERDYRFFIPLYAHYGEGARRFNAAVPLWVSYDSAKGRKFRMFFPLYWRFLQKEPAVETGGSAEAGPAARRERDIVVVGNWYRVDTRDGVRRSRTVGLAPFFANTVAGPDDRYFEVLGGLFGRDVQAGRRRFRWLYFFYTRPQPLGR